MWHAPECALPKERVSEKSPSGSGVSRTHRFTSQSTPLYRLWSWPASDAVSYPARLMYFSPIRYVLLVPR
jgi:hypothetical protein